MLGRTRNRISSAVDLLRPRTFFRTLARVDALVDSTRELAASVEALRIQTEQLMTIQRLDWEKRDEVGRLDRALDAARIEAHVATAIDAATMEPDPFPHIVVKDWLPPETYKRIVDAIPPAVFFADRDQTRADQSKQRMIVPFSVAPAYSRVVWNFVADTIVGDILNRALNTKFQKVLCEYVRSFCPALSSDIDLTMHPSDGRIMLRRPGYNLTPHRDPKWGFATGLVYLARPGDNEVHGTRLYRVREDAEAPSGKVYYVEQDRCELVKTVPFRPNTLLAFLNSSGAHSASIPADAEPADLERYLYQFRLGPTATTIKRLLQAMPPDKAALWAGDKSDRAAGY
jgi:hypothetical protein